MSEKLDDILTKLVNGDLAYRELVGGLRLQMKQPTEVLEFWRLACYRVGNKPSEKELATVRRYLEPLLPAGVDVELGPEQNWTGQDGKARTGRAFSWRKPAATQGQLI